MGGGVFPLLFDKMHKICALLAALRWLSISKLETKSRGLSSYALDTNSALGELILLLQQAYNATAVIRQMKKLAMNKEENQQQQQQAK